MNALAWTPVRYVPDGIWCDCCDERITRAAPGRTTGTRGTKAYFCKQIGQWECMRCRAIGERCDRARAECAGCAAHVPRWPSADGWIHQARGGHLGGHRPDQVATLPCTFHDDDEATAAPVRPLAREAA